MLAPPRPLPIVVSPPCDGDAWTVHNGARRAPALGRGARLYHEILNDAMKGCALEAARLALRQLSEVSCRLWNYVAKLPRRAGREVARRRAAVRHARTHQSDNNPALRFAAYADLHPHALCGGGGGGSGGGGGGGGGQLLGRGQAANFRAHVVRGCRAHP